MQRLKDAAMLLKAKITKDETEELLIQATSEENWQTPTPILHEICNVAYNYEEWQKIQTFVWEKLKLKKWRKVLKTLNLVEFLLKNGPSSTISTFKHQVYVFRSLDNFNSHDQGVDRGQAIRERAKAIVQLLTNQQLLEQERTKAKAIKQRMGQSSGSGSNYKGTGSRGFNSGSSKYDGYDSKGKGSSNSYGSGGGSLYGGSSVGDTYSGSSGGSNLNKYKKDLGGQSAYKKTTQQKKTEDKKAKIFQYIDPQREDQSAKTKPKPFDQQGRKLQKPGQVTVDLSKKIKAPLPNGTNMKSKPSGGFDFFGEQQSKPAQTQTKTQNNNNSPFGQFTFTQQQPNKLPQPQVQPQIQIQTQIPTPTSTQQHNLVNITGLNLFGNQTNQQPTNNLGFNFNLSPNLQTPQVQPQFQQQPTVNINQRLLGLGNISMNPKPANTNQFSLNPSSNNNDQFGGFDTGHKQIGWMSADQSNLTNLSDFSKQVSEKNIAQNKKTSNEGNLLATSQDFNFMTTPSTNFDLGMNFGLNPQAQKVNNTGYNNLNLNFNGQNQYQQQNTNQLGSISFF